jgi:hypothetical protein
MHRTDDEDERDIFRLLEAVDREPPDQTAEAVAAIARSRRRRAGIYRWAAVILLVMVVGGVAYALPGSPVRAWLENLLASPRSAPGRVEPASRELAMAGISVAPDERMAIVFDHPPAGSRALVTVVDQAQLSVETAAGAARFTAGSGRVLVTITRDSALVQVRIPHSAARLEIRVAGRVLFQKIGDEIIGPSPQPDSTYTLLLAP